MNLFDRLVGEALKNNTSLSPLRIVVEKELLHHDILRILSQHNLLHQLTFIGGTCLRSCYGGVRLSEDLDFTGGTDFTKDQLSTMSVMIEKELKQKYGLNTSVTEPKKDTGNVDTWKIKVQTRPKSKHLPQQLINIVICALTSFDKQPRILLNPYHVDMGTNGLVIQCQSREEIYTDKIIALALRPNRIKHRDLWDIMWLHQHNIKPKLDLIKHKLKERHVTYELFYKQLQERLTSLEDNNSIETDFYKEMQRFLPPGQVTQLQKQPSFWQSIVYILKDIAVLENI